MLGTSVDVSQPLYFYRRFVNGLEKLNKVDRKRLIEKFGEVVDLELDIIETVVKLQSELNPDALWEVRRGDWPEIHNDLTICEKARLLELAKKLNLSVAEVDLDNAVTGLFYFDY